MQQELITIIIITSVYMQLIVQWHNVKCYAVTHQEEVHCVRLCYDTEHLLKFFGVFSDLPSKNRPWPLPSTYFKVSIL
jgi:hypothetical protein